MRQKDEKSNVTDLECLLEKNRDMMILIIK